jgi:ABC-type dipeptide/oligopeptide/nickel transport system permease component
MLKKYPTLRFIMMRSGWYILTFFVAVAINFYLPRLGDNNPVDIIMGQAGSGLSTEAAREKEEKYLKEFGLVKVRDSVYMALVDSTAVREEDGKRVEAVVTDEAGQPVKKAEPVAMIAKVIVRDTVVAQRAVTTRDTVTTDVGEIVRDTVKTESGEIVLDTVKTEGGVITLSVRDTVRLRDTETVVSDTLIKPVRASNFDQFISYVGMCLKGDLGTSFQKYPKKVLDVIIEAVPWTIALQLPTILFGWIIGNTLGALAAYKRGMFDKVFFPCALALSAFPFFVFGMLLVYVFSIVWHVFPAMGGYEMGIIPSFSWTFFSSVAYHYVLPFFSIFLILAGGQAIGMRSMGIYELGTDYIKYAKWLGLKEWRVLFYVFRNAMLPQITGLALQLGVMIGGALITEMIFSYPGLGMAMLTAIQNQDYPVIQGVTLIITLTVLLANFTVDILIAILDPRVKAGLQMGKGN